MGLKAMPRRVWNSATVGISQPVSDLGLHRLAMSYRKYARLIWVKSDAAKFSGFSTNENLN